MFADCRRMLRRVSINRPILTRGYANDIGVASLCAHGRSTSAAGHANASWDLVGMSNESRQLADGFLNVIVSSGSK